ncbi:hypothetical protein E2C01_065246 [Portunus trituberculatus]|uniref:Secreted protein n=1 Tax=Portunus trituberculatus TaxID=210409 RepID=A0A5B7HMH4_PORTR|nr:hypothetical protein [Portunus trituberculatus]
MELSLSFLCLEAVLRIRVSEASDCGEPRCRLSPPQRGAAVLKDPCTGAAVAQRQAVRHISNMASRHGSHKVDRVVPGLDYG